jgi:carbon-monoxide dehydrogenase medium subunit
MSSLIRDETVNRRYPALVAAASVVGSVQIRNRATLAGNLCNASPAADTAPALLVHGASAVIRGDGTSRTVPLDEFFVGPGSTALAAGELVTAIDIPLPSPGTGSAFARVTRRRGVDLASVNLACVVDRSGRVRFGFGAVAPTPLVVETSIDELETQDGFEHMLSVTSPISDVRAHADYRRAMLRVHARRALQTAIVHMKAAS